MKRFLLSGAALALPAGMAQADYTLHVIHINDLHSRIESVSKYDGTCGADDEAEGKCFGGVARVAAKVMELRDRLKTLADERRRFGYRRLHILLRQEGWW